jgi:hypothetical protein
MWGGQNILSPFKWCFHMLLLFVFLKLLFPLIVFPVLASHLDERIYGVFFVRCQLTTTGFTRAFARNRVQSWNDVPRFFPSQESSPNSVNNLAEAT